jgi:hypothetical protein
VDDFDDQSGYITALTDCGASGNSWTSVPNRKIGRLYDGAVNEAATNDRT